MNGGGAEEAANEVGGGMRPNPRGVGIAGHAGVRGTREALGKAIAHQVLEGAASQARGAVEPPATIRGAATTQLLRVLTPSAAVANWLNLLVVGGKGAFYAYKSIWVDIRYVNIPARTKKAINSSSLLKADAYQIISKVMQEH